MDGTVLLLIAFGRRQQFILKAQSTKHREIGSDIKTDNPDATNIHQNDVANISCGDGLCESSVEDIVLIVRWVSGKITCCEIEVIHGG